MKKTIELTVRTYEVDGYNHVNNAVYLNYLEFARMEFLKLIQFDYIGLINEGYMLYVTRVDIRYKYSARFGDTLAIEVAPIKLGKVSGIFSQIVRNQHGAICAEAEVSWACVDKSGKPSKIPDSYMVSGLYPEEG